MEHRVIARVKMMSERLQKVLAHAGVASRRKSEELIRQGRVTVDGGRAEIGMKVEPDEVEIRVDGKKISAPERKVYILLNKPTGVLSSTRSQGGLPTVLDLISVDERVYPVGRLDLDSEGLILLTNDGDLANRLTHPRYEHEKEYRVQLDRRPDEEQLEAWRHGVVLEDGFRTKPARIWRESSDTRSEWVRIVLEEGRKRQIRNTAERLGLRVRRLIRTRIHTIELGALASGEWRMISGPEIKAIKTASAKQG
jgi:23S rRNA pseudouridine2605 synthase